MREPHRAIGKKEDIANDLISGWKNQGAAQALKNYWTEKTRARAAFTPADAIAQILYNLERYESALGKIAALSGAGAQIASETLAYRRPDCS